MNINAQAIGVFDSGMGGLTVLRALKEQLPQESFIYLGDTARLPYGTKSPETVKHYAIQMARVLVERDIKALVIACNTATTAALAYLQTMLPAIPVLGVVTPGAQAAVAATQKQQIMVWATETTIASNAYQQQIQVLLPAAAVTSQSCSVLVALAEAGMVANSVAYAALKHYLAVFDTEDTLVLGCTHFPVFKPLLTSLLAPHVTIVDSAYATAVALKERLIASHLLAQQQLPMTTYLVTDSIARFQQTGALFLNEPIPAECIELVDAAPLSIPGDFL